MNTKIRRIAAGLLLCLLIAMTLTAASCGPETSEDGNFAVLTVEGYGKIVVELYPDVAPITVANFKKLVNSHFYDGLIFHRVISGFMIQGGDPKGNGTGGSEETITGEFAANNITNNLSHTRGVISMAREGHKYESLVPDIGNVTFNSASSQFFICHQDSPHLDGNYAAFGRVVSGMDVVDKIAAVETDPNDKPYKDVVIKSIILKNSAN